MGDQGARASQSLVRLVRPGGSKAQTLLPGWRRRACATLALFLDEASMKPASTPKKRRASMKQART
jgi:hypothetical protein